MADPKPLPAFITATSTPADELDTLFFRGKKMTQHDFKERTGKLGGPGAKHSHRRGWRSSSETRDTTE